MSYGLEIFNAAGTKILGQTDRVLRFVSQGTVTVNRNSHVDITISGMANDDSWVVGFTTSMLQLWDDSADFSATKSANNLRIGYNISPITQYTPANRSIIYYVFRS